MQRSDNETAAGETPDASIIKMIGVNKWFGTFQVLKDVHLEVRRGARVVICGPSGSGKSTLIRCLNQLEEHQQGAIVIDGVSVSRTMRNIATLRSEIGMVFQSFNLFPHLTALRIVRSRPRRFVACVRKTPRNSRWACSTACMSRTRRINIRRSFRAVSSSVWRSPARCA